jgi:hypothetical protein
MIAVFIIIMILLAFLLLSYYSRNDFDYDPNRYNNDNSYGINLKSYNEGFDNSEICKPGCSAPTKQTSNCRPLKSDDPNWIINEDDPNKIFWYYKTDPSIKTYQQPSQIVDKTKSVCPWNCTSTDFSGKDGKCIYDSECSTCSPKTIYKNSESMCPNSAFGCCADGVTERIDSSGTNCRTTPSASCALSTFGCCADRITKRNDVAGTNCPRVDENTGSTGGHTGGYTWDDNYRWDDDYLKDDDNYTRGDNNYTRGDDNYTRGDDNYTSGDDNYTRGDDYYRGGTGGNTGGDYNHYDSDNYILKTRIVPPICPTCPNILYPDANAFDETNKIAKNNNNTDQCSSSTTTTSSTKEFCPNDIVYPNVPYPILPDFTTFGI